MSKGLLFWILMILWLVLGILHVWPGAPSWGGDVLLFILLALLGWHCFGAAIQ